MERSRRTSTLARCQRRSGSFLDQIPVRVRRLVWKCTLERERYQYQLRSSRVLLLGGSLARLPRPEATPSCRRQEAPFVRGSKCSLVAMEQFCAPL